MRDLSPLFAPRSIAILGASTNPGKLGAMMARQLSHFHGTVSLINSRTPDTQKGVYSSVGELTAETGEPPDLVVCCVPAEATPTALAEASGAGVRAAVVCAGGFAEVDDAGRRRQDELARLSARTGLRILGPNTSGFIVPRSSLFASFVRGAETISPGSAAVVAASGGMNHALAFALSSEGVGVDLAVGLGNSVDVTAADVVEFVAQRAHIRCIALHVESVDDGLALTESIRKATELVPVVALVVGQSDVSDFARSHTGSLATSWRTTRSALRQAGAVIVDDERQLIDAVGALSIVRLPSGSAGRVGLVTAQAGPGLLLADRLKVSGAQLPRLEAQTTKRLEALLPPMTYQSNPVDTGRPGNTFRDVLSAVVVDPAVDILAAYGLLEPDAVDLVECVSSVRSASIPIVAVITGDQDQVATARVRLRRAGVVGLATPAAAVHAVAALRQDAEGQARLRRGEDPAGEDIPPLLLTERPNESTLKDLLRRSGVDTPRGVICADMDQALGALRMIGSPVVVKMLEPVVDHKTERGAVHLGVSIPADMDRAVQALRAIGATSFLVEEMAPSGAEVLLGARRDPVFGPILVLGLGGVAAELMGDVAIRMAPLSVSLISEMLDELSLGALLRGYRGAPAVDELTLYHAARVVEAIVLGNPAVSSFEINPLRVLSDGRLVALDATIAVEPDSAAAFAAVSNGVASTTQPDISYG